MTNLQYNELCNAMGKKLTDKELQEMGFSMVDGEFDEDLDFDIGLLKFEQFKDKCRREQK